MNCSEHPSFLSCSRGIPATRQQQQAGASSPECDPHLSERPPRCRGEAGPRRVWADPDLPPDKQKVLSPSGWRPYPTSNSSYTAKIYRPTPGSLNYQCQKSLSMLYSTEVKKKKKKMPTHFSHRKLENGSGPQLLTDPTQTLTGTN